MECCLHISPHSFDNYLVTFAHLLFYRKVDARTVSCYPVAEIEN